MRGHLSSREFAKDIPNIKCSLLKLKESEGQWIPFSLYINTALLNISLPYYVLVSMVPLLVLRRWVCTVLVLGTYYVGTTELGISMDLCGTYLPDSKMIGSILSKYVALL